MQTLSNNSDDVPQVLNRQTPTPANVADNVIVLKDYAIHHADGPLLSDVNLSIRRGEVAYLIGKSGSGKTSLLRTLYADRKIDGGTAFVCGFDLTKIPRRRIPKLRRRLGIIFQNPRLLNDRDVYDNLHFVLKATGWHRNAEIEERILKVLADVGLAEKVHSHPQSLSEGERQRVGIARAIINKPELILADEPTGNLDPVTSSEIIGLLHKINQETNTTLFISTHDFLTIDKFPARVLCCKDGRVVDVE